VFDDEQNKELLPVGMRSYIGNKYLISGEGIQFNYSRYYIPLDGRINQRSHMSDCIRGGGGSKGRLCKMRKIGNMNCSLKGAISSRFDPF